MSYIFNEITKITEKLKNKPINTEKGIKGINIKVKPIMINDIIKSSKDDGSKALDILNQMTKLRLTKVTHKNIYKPEIISNVPINIEIKRTKKRKQHKTIIIEDDGHIGDNENFKGGPELDDNRINDDDDDDDNEPNTIHKKYTNTSTAYKPKPGIIDIGDIGQIIIADIPLAERLPITQPINVKASKYYMNNRETFVKFIDAMFSTYKNELLDDNHNITCDTIGNSSGDFDLLTHQKIVRDYMNLYTPYRGLLLYHGLGSGKSCSSIAIAEGMKSGKKIIIMTPAALKRNYLEEIKKCGDLIYKKNQFWEWISITEHPNSIQPLSKSLNLPVEYIKRHKGAWLTNVKEKSNYNELTTNEKKVLNEQIDEMIQRKYTFINYNGLRKHRFKQLTNNYKTNIFDNSVVIIDEAHNLVSRIVSKINKSSKFAENRSNTDKNDVLALQLYEFLLKSQNTRIVLLTGTPIINYPNEIGILFNILRGYIKTWKLTLDVKTTNKINTEKLLDYIDYSSSSKTLIITRNPYGFENTFSKTKYNGVTRIDERGTITDDAFIRKITQILLKNGIEVIPSGTSITLNTALPDTLDSFIGNFISSFHIKC